MKNHLLNNQKIKELLKANKIVLLDGGARGEVFSPFNEVDKDILQILRFEPDPNAEIIVSENEIMVPKALWNKEETIELNLAIEPTASSVFPFNEQLQQYIDPHRDLRKTKEKVSVEAINLDHLLENKVVDHIDFIKLDIHGCEFEVLEGAKAALQDTLGLLVENWIIPVHKGQKTRAAVELSLIEKGFYVFEEYLQSEWAREASKFLKRQPVTVDSLYFRDPLIDQNVTTEIQAVKLIGISDLFGHYGFATQLTQFFKAQGILNDEWHTVLAAHFKKHYKVSFKDRWKNKLFMLAKDRANDCSFK